MQTVESGATITGTSFTGLNEAVAQNAINGLVANYAAFAQANLSPNALVRDVVGYRSRARWASTSGATSSIQCRPRVDPAGEVRFMLASGSFGSAAEHALSEQLYGTPAVSTERLLTLANRSAIPIFTIDATNIATILPQLDTFPRSRIS